MSERRSFRDILFPGKRGESIKPLVEELKAGTHELSTDSDPGSSKEKREAYAISAYFTKDIQDLLDRSWVPAKGPIPIYKEFHHPPEPHHRPLDFTDEEHFGPHVVDFVANLIALEREYSTQFFEALYRKWSPRMKSLPATSKERQIYDRFAEVAKRHAKNVHMTPEIFIFRGAGTASRVSWNMMRAIPVLFKQKYNKTITPEEFRHIAKSGEQLAFHMSDMHLDGLATLANFNNDQETLRKERIPVGIPMEILELTEDENGKPVFLYDETKLKQFEIYNIAHNLGDIYVEKTDTFGCPARIVEVTGVDGKPQKLIFYVYERYMALAERFLVPQLDRYTKEVFERAKPKAPASGTR